MPELNRIINNDDHQFQGFVRHDVDEPFNPLLVEPEPAPLDKWFSYTFNLPAFWRSEGGGKASSGVELGSPPPLLQRAHCKTCKYWEGHDGRGNLWSVKGNCTFYPIAGLETAAEFHCPHFLFNETLRDAK